VENDCDAHDDVHWHGQTHGSSYLTLSDYHCAKAKQATSSSYVAKHCHAPQDEAHSNFALVCAQDRQGLRDDCALAKAEVMRKNDFESVGAMNRCAKRDEASSSFVPVHVLRHLADGV
jgi:hypothetical protein